MGGQAGSARDLLSYTTDSDTILGGLNVHPTEALTLGLHMTLNTAEAGLEPFDLPADDYNATHPPTMFDFSQSPSFSDLDMTWTEAVLSLDYKVGESIWVFGSYRYVDLEDDAPYLYDTSGSADIYTVAVGWVF